MPRVTQQRIGLVTALKNRRGGQTRSQGRSTFIMHRVYSLALAIDVVAGLGVIDQRQIQHVEPDHRRGAVVTMLMPQASRGQDQITTAHGALLAVHCGVSALAFHDHAHGVRRVAVARRPFAGKQQLHTQVNRGARLHLVQTMPGIGQHEHAAFGLFDRRELAGLEQKRPDVTVGPAGRTRLARRDFGWQNTTQARPQRHQVEIAQVLDVVLRQIFDSS